MKLTMRLVVACLLMCFVPALFGVQNDNKSINRSKEDKNRLPDVVVKGSLEQINSVLVREMSNNKFTLDKESPHELVFHKEMTGVGGFLLGNTGNRAKEQVTFLITTVDNVTTVQAKANALIPNRSGGWDVKDANSKGTKKNLQNILDTMKKEIEETKP